MVFIILCKIDPNKLFFVPKLRMHLNCGTFVVYEREKNGEIVTTAAIGRVLEVGQYENSIKINQYSLLNPKEASPPVLATHC